MSDLDFMSIPLDQPLPFVQEGYRLFPGEVLNALIYRLNNGGSVTIPVPVIQGGTGAEDAEDARTNLGLQIGVDVQPFSNFLTSAAALADNGLIVRVGADAFARSLTAPAAGMTITNPGGVAGNPTFAFTGNLLALVGLAGTGIAVQTGAGTWAQRTLTAGTGLTITNGDGVAGNPTAAINLAASLTWTGVPRFDSGAMVSEDGLAIGAGGATDALLYQPAVDQLAIAVGASTFTFSAASLSLNGNAFLTAAAIGTTVQAYSATLTALSAATANGVSLVTAANYAAMRGLLTLVPGTDVQVYSAALTTIAGLAPSNGDFLQYTAGAWANRTAAQATATLSNFVGDSGAGGTKGLVPAPGVGEGALFLKGDGTWSAPAGSGDVVGPVASTSGAAATFNGITGKLLQDSKVILTVPLLAATLTLGSGKTATISNTLTFTGTDGSTLAIGAGGTLGALSFITPAANVATFLTTPTSANLLAAVTDETGTGSLVFATSPTLVTPLLGTPTSGVLTNCTGLPVGSGISGLASGIATFLATPTSANLLAAVTDETGTGALVFATSPTLVTPILGTPTSGNLSNCTADGTDAVGFRNIPVNSQSTAYTAVLADAGKQILHPAADTNARTFTIPANASVAYPVGTALTFTNETSQVVTIAITTDTLVLAGSTTTGSRSLAQNGIATAVKITTTKWLISGAGLT